MKNLINILFRGWLIIWLPLWWNKIMKGKGYASNVKPTMFVLFAIIVVTMLLTGNREFMTWWKYLFIALALGIFFLLKPYVLGAKYKGYIPEKGVDIYPNWYVYLCKKPKL